MSADSGLLLPTQSPTNNPRLEFRDGQFLFTMQTLEGGKVERFLSSAAVRQAFSGISIDSGWLRPEVVRWGTGVSGEWAVLFIEPQEHELELTTEATSEGEGGPSVVSTVDRVKVQLPGIVMFGLQSQYYAWAVKTDQLKPDHEIYRCPLPNVEADGRICWGLLKPPTASARSVYDAWLLFVRSTFNNHFASGKSKAYPEDVRTMLRLSAREGYPRHDLVRQVLHTGATLDKTIREFFETGEMPS